MACVFLFLCSTFIDGGDYIQWLYVQCIYLYMQGFSHVGRKFNTISSEQALNHIWHWESRSFSAILQLCLDFQLHMHMHEHVYLHCASNIIWLQQVILHVDIDLHLQLLKMISNVFFLFLILWILTSDLPPPSDILYTYLRGQFTLVFFLKHLG